MKTMTSALALTALALACSALPAAAEAAETAYRLAVRGEPKSLDPHRVSGAWENYIMGDAFLGLLTDAADATPIPGAAESWTVSDDGLTYTFKLRDHMWSDGTKVTAEDFVYSMRRILAPEFAGEYAYLLYPIKNAEQLNAGQVKGMENLGVRAVDDATLEITLKEPTGFFLELLTHYTSFAVPRHVVEREGADWVKPGKFVSNGAYHVVEWVPNSRVVSEKNPHFYDAANVEIDKVTYFPDEDGPAVVKRFRAGEIDYVHEFPSEQIDFLKSELPTATRVYPHLGTYYYTINTTRKPFDDPRVRKALSLAVDRAAITDKVLRTGELPAFGVVPPKTGTYGEPYAPEWAAQDFKARQEQAKALLAEAGHGPDNPLKLELSYNTSENHKRIAVAAQAMLKQAGVQAELVNREVKVHYDLLEQNQFDVARAAWVADYNDPQNFLSLLETRTGVKNYGRFSDPDFDRLMAESGAERDPEKRNALMREAEKIAVEKDAWIPIYYYVSKVLLSDKVEGFVENTKQTHRTRWLTLKP